jgi:LPS-assembly protein
MGFAVSFSFKSIPRRPQRGRTARAGLLALAVACLAAWPHLVAAPAAAETPPAAADSTQAKPQDKLVIDADELVYDKDKNTVTAEGSVQLFYQGRLLQADKVIYERASKRVYAQGHAKMTDEHGDVIYGSRFELSDDFRDGFIDSVQVLTADKTRFSSPRVERSTGDITVLQNGAYTACEPCKDHPERPPFWQVRATKIIENQETHTIYYENAQLQFWGFPVFWFPYFSSPDATVNKQTGLLAPAIVSGNNLGASPRPTCRNRVCWAKSTGGKDCRTAPTTSAQPGSTRSSPAHFPAILTERADIASADRSNRPATSFSTTCGSSAGTAHG